jgi:hypothetical protein
VKRHLTLIATLLFSLSSFGQSSFFTSRNELLNHFVEKQLALNRANNSLDISNFHSELKPFNRTDLHQFVQAKKFELVGKSGLEWNFLVESTMSEELNGVKKSTTLYKSKSDFYQYGDNQSFGIFINPVLGLEFGSETEDGERYFRNTRGVRINGHIGNKIGFYTYFTDNQMFVPQYVQEKIAAEGVIPGQGFWKKFKDDGLDYFDARGYITFSPVQQVKMSFGNDRNFIGNGYRSLLLSDYAKDYLQLKIQTKLGRIHYQNLFMEFRNYSQLVGNTLLEKKYGVIHRLGVNIGDWGNIGVFESIIFNRPDSVGQGFELSYLNPVIFYRSIEQNMGSHDNALLGMDFKARVFPKMTVYGQLLLDEFKLDELKASDGWWANKFGIQAGAKYYNVFDIPLDLQAEFNVVKPYTYAHTNTSQSYSHYGQALAHPLGANFTELVGQFRYHPKSKGKWNNLFITGRISLANQGVDTSFTSANFGGNIFKSNETRVSDYDNELIQGIDQKLSVISLEVSYMVWQNVFLDFSVFYRDQDSEYEPLSRKSMLYFLGMRYNLSRVKYDY